MAVGYKRRISLIAEGIHRCHLYTVSLIRASVHARRHVCARTCVPGVLSGCAAVSRHQRNTAHDGVHAPMHVCKYQCTSDTEKSRIVVVFIDSEKSTVRYNGSGEPSGQWIHYDNDNYLMIYSI
jgi:hypothetical protein